MMNRATGIIVGIGKRNVYEWLRTRNRELRRLMVVLECSRRAGTVRIPATVWVRGHLACMPYCEPIISNLV